MTASVSLCNTQRVSKTRRLGEFSEPEIEIIDGQPETISDRVGLPRRFVARFPDDHAGHTVSIMVAVREKRPEIRQVTVTARSGSLEPHDLRLPLQSKLLPAAVKRACFSVWRDLVARPGTTTDGPDTIVLGPMGPITLTGRMERDNELYESAARTVRQRSGRPQHVSSVEDMAELATIYNERRSISDLMNRLNVSRSTAHRRRREAIERGFLAGP